MDDGGRWLVVAGQDSNDLTSLMIDQTTGKLTPTNKLVKVGHPVCVIFGFDSESKIFLQ